MKLIALAFILMLLSGIAGADIPIWVQPGVTASYNVDLVSNKSGGPSSPGHTTVTMQVDAVSEDAVTGTVRTYNDFTRKADTQQVTCAEGGIPCRGRFWLDPRDPAASIKDDAGGTYAVAGQEPYQLLGKIWDATVLQHKDPAKGIFFQIVYDTQTGLILSYITLWANEEAHLTLHSIDAGAYAPEESWKSMAK